MALCLLIRKSDSQAGYTVVIAPYFAILSPSFNLCVCTFAVGTSLRGHLTARKDVGLLKKSIIYDLHVLAFDLMLSFQEANLHLFNLIETNLHYR